jgi:hypothetical protein
MHDAVVKQRELAGLNSQSRTHRIVTRMAKYVPKRSCNFFFCRLRCKTVFWTVKTICICWPWNLTARPWLCKSAVEKKGRLCQNGAAASRLVPEPEPGKAPVIAMQHACPDARLAGTYNSVGHMSSFATVSCHAWNSLQVARQPRSAGFRPCNAQAQKWRGPLLPGCRLPLQNGQVFVRQRGAAGDRGSAARAGLHPPSSTFGSGSARRPCSCSWSSTQARDDFHYRRGLPDTLSLCSPAGSPSVIIRVGVVVRNAFS